MLGIIKIFLKIPKWSFLSIYYCLSSGPIAEKSDEHIYRKVQKIWSKMILAQKNVQFTPFWAQ